MLSKNSLCEWEMTLVKFTAIYFAVLPSPFMWSDGFSFPALPLLLHLGRGKQPDRAHAGTLSRYRHSGFSRILGSSTPSVV